MGMLTLMEGISIQLIMGSRSNVSCCAYGRISFAGIFGVWPASTALYARA